MKNKINHKKIMALIIILIWFLFIFYENDTSENTNPVGKTCDRLTLSVIECVDLGEEIVLRQKIRKEDCSIDYHIIKECRSTCTNLPYGQGKARCIRSSEILNGNGEFESHILVTDEDGIKHKYSTDGNREIY